MRARACLCALAVTAFTTTVSLSAMANTLQVGPGKTYAAPCAALAAAVDGDTIEIDTAGSYVGDVCGMSANGLHITGVGGGYAKIDAGGQNSQGKGIWVVGGNDTTIENIEFTGAAVDDENGAGIRLDGSGLTVRHCYFHDNEDGILTAPGADSEVLIEYSEFDRNGQGIGCNDQGCAHNLYIGHVKKLTFQFNYSHGVLHSHLLKSRAAENLVQYNLFSTLDGSGSYELEFPNGGLTYVIGNVIVQGTGSENPNMLGYQFEGAAAENPSHDLFVVNNTFVNMQGGGNFIALDDSVAVPAVARNNVFFGAGNPSNQASAVIEASCTADPLFVDAASLDFHLGAGSPCAETGIAPGIGDGLDLTPTSQYVHPLGGEGRTTVGVIDAGAFELGGGSSSTSTGGAGTGSASGSGSSTMSGDPSTGSGAAAGGSGGAGASGNDDGCSCRVAEPAKGRNLGALALSALGLYVVRRRRLQRLHATTAR